MAEPFAYDVVGYPSTAMPQAHPSHLFAVAHMFGLDPAPVEHCRYLELGCGDGMHLIACALGLPEATLIGVDLSTAAIERGNRVIAELGLTNVSLYAADLTQWQPPPGGFDYIVAHGLFSWVPAPVREGLFALYARSLRPTGVGYISYNVYPGCYIRRMIWEILRQHTEGFPEPEKKIQQARELIKFLLCGQPEGKDPLRSMYRHELDQLLNHHDSSVLYHDDLATVNDPVYFHEFMAQAARHQLRFVSESEQNSMEPRAFSAEVANVLISMAEKDVLHKEQYLDYLRIRRFRQTLLSPDGQKPRARPDETRIAQLAVSGQAKWEGDIDLTPGVAVTFTGERGSLARTDWDIVKAALIALTERWPERIPYPQVVGLALAKLGREQTPDDASRLAQMITTVWMTGMVELFGHVPRYTPTPSERPVATPLARFQMKQGMLATTLLHTTMHFEDAPSQLLLQLLDGSRDREQLAEAVQEAFPADNRPDPVALREGLERNLNRLANAGMLIR